MNATPLSIARELKTRLMPAVDILDFRMFGSCARGQYGEDSDIDVYIEIEQLTRKAKQTIRDISWTVGLEREAVISPLIFSRDEIENSPLRESPIVENILREGILL